MVILAVTLNLCSNAYSVFLFFCYIKAFPNEQSPRLISFHMPIKPSGMISTQCPAVINVFGHALQGKIV